MLLPYRVQPNNSNKRTKKVSDTNHDNNSHRDHDLKRPQMTSYDLAKTTIKSNRRNKNNLKVGSMNEKTQFIDKFLDEILHNNNIRTLIYVIIALYSHC